MYQSSNVPRFPNRTVPRSICVPSVNSQHTAESKPNRNQGSQCVCDTLCTSIIYSYLLQYMIKHSVEFKPGYEGLRQV